MITGLLKLLASLAGFLCSIGALFFVFRFALKLLPEFGQKKLFDKTDEYADYLLNPIRSRLPAPEERIEEEGCKTSPDWAELIAALIIWVAGKLLKVLV